MGRDQLSNLEGSLDTVYTEVCMQVLQKELVEVFVPEKFFVSSAVQCCGFLIFKPAFQLAASLRNTFLDSVQVIVLYLLLLLSVLE